MYHRTNVPFEKVDYMNNVTINQQARLSEHFTLAELCKTSVKTADGNIPSRKRIRCDALQAFQIICTFAYSFINMQLYELQRSKYPL